MHKKALKDKEKNRFYCCITKNYGFQLNLIFYNVSKNTNGKILLKMYRNQILELVVKSWLLKGQDVILKKENRSGYGKTHNRNIIQVV